MLLGPHPEHGYLGMGFGGHPKTTREHCLAGPMSSCLQSQCPKYLYLFYTLYISALSTGRDRRLKLQYQINPGRLCVPRYNLSPSRYFRENSFYQSPVNSWHNRCLRNRFCPGHTSTHILLFLNQPSPQQSPQSRLSWDGAGNKSREYMRPPLPLGLSWEHLSIPAGPSSSSPKVDQGRLWLQSVCKHFGGFFCSKS